MARRKLGIFGPEDLKRMLLHQEHEYILQKDIDLEGALWIPPERFSSRLDGNGKTIRNGRVICAADGCQGFFGTVTEEGAVWDLTLDRLQLVSDDSARYIGAIAGVNRGSLENITITGRMFDCSPDSIVGVAVGCNQGVISAVRSQLHVTAPEHKKIALVGEQTQQAKTQGVWRDYRYTDRPLSAESVAMRHTAVSHSQRMGTHPWHVPARLSFRSPYLEACSQEFLPEETYYGLPFTNKYGSYERFAYCLDEENTVKPWVMALGDGYDGFDRYMGADCSGHIYWSWARVCSSISFDATVHMVPTAENQQKYGVLPVGNYRAEPDGEGRPCTLPIIAQNGEEAILECLAQLRYGDAIVNYLPQEGGHTKLVIRDPLIYRDQEGRICREESVIFTNELGGTGSDLTGGYSRWGLDRENTFASLLELGYLPITTREFAEGKRTPIKLEAAVTGPAEGTVESNYRIISTCVVLEREGRECCRSLQFTAVAPTAPGFIEDAARTTVRKVDLGCHREDLQNLPEGDYRCRVEVLLSTGKTYTAWDQPVRL